MSTLFPKLSEIESSKLSSTKTSDPFPFVKATPNMIDEFADNDRIVKELLTSTIGSLEAQVEAWLIEKFGSWEEVVRMAPYFVLEYTELEFKQDSDGFYRGTQDVRIRVRTPEEREEFRSYSD